MPTEARSTPGDSDPRARAGRRLWVGIPGPTLDAETRGHLERIRPGGIVLFARNVAGREQLAALTAALRDSLGPALHIAVDQEGGRVVRLGREATVFPGNMALGAVTAARRERGRALARLQGWWGGFELARLGIDVNLAPCVDLLVEPENRVIGTRSFGADPYLVGELAAAICDGQRRGGVLSTAKHFPGLGHAALDPHRALPRVGGARWQDGLLPFRRAIECGCPIVMSTHLIVEALDRERPVTISPAAVRLLRQDLGFDGVLVSDDLEMGAIAEAGAEEIVRGTIASGHDVLLIASDASFQRRAFDLLGRAIEEEATWLGDLRATDRRLLALAAPLAAPPPPRPSAAEVAAVIAREAITLLGGDPRDLLLARGGDALLVAPIDDSLRGEDLAGLESELDGYCELRRLTAAEVPAAAGWLAGEARRRRSILLFLNELRFRPEYQSLLGAAGSIFGRRIVVLGGDPFDARTFPEQPRTAVLCAYGYGSAAQGAVGAVLRGDLVPDGVDPLRLANREVLM